MDSFAYTRDLDHLIMSRAKPMVRSYLMARRGRAAVLCSSIPMQASVEATMHFPKEQISHTRLRSHQELWLRLCHSHGCVLDEFYNKGLKLLNQGLDLGCGFMKRTTEKI